MSTDIYILKKSNKLHVHQQQSSRIEFIWRECADNSLCTSGIAAIISATSFCFTFFRTVLPLWMVQMSNEYTIFFFSLIFIT